MEKELKLALQDAANWETFLTDEERKLPYGVAKMDVLDRIYKKHWYDVSRSQFSRWLRDFYLPHTSGFIASDVDFVLYDYVKKKVALVEVKTKNARFEWWQEKFYESLDKWISAGIDEDWEYVGFYLVQFEKNFFDDGECKLNGVVRTEEEVKYILSNFIKP